MPLEPIDIKGMIALCEHTALAWCVSGLHYGVTLPGITVCPMCTEAVRALWGDNDG